MNGINNLKGGNQKLIPLYTEPKNSPFKTNEEKIATINYNNENNNTNLINDYVKNDYSRSFVDKKNNNPKLNNPNLMKKEPILDFKLYPQEQPKPKQEIPSLFMPITNTNLTYPAQFTNYPNYYIPVVKNYNISAGGPVGDHVHLASVIEDILPTKDIKATPNTISERLIIHQFVRSVFITQGDGQEIDITGESQTSLLNYVKPLELNPNNTNQVSLNPYLGLPDNTIFYKSCYPIRYDREKYSTQCAKDSIGMYVRIYGLSVAEYNTRNLTGNAYYLYDNWREIAYYEYVREKILKANICPNFTVLFGYFVCHNCNIDFVKLNMYKNRKIITGSRIDYNSQLQRLPFGFNGDIPNDLKWLDDITRYFNTNPSNNLIPVLPYLKNSPDKNAYFKLVSPIVRANEFLKNYSGNVLVTLSEAPTQSIFMWASKKYLKMNDGKSSAMINTGIHDSKTWRSIIFQIIMVLTTLQSHNIVFNNLSMNNNFYIQDTKTNTNNTDYWKYIINGIEYYIPNYGYLVMFDSNFKDIKSEFSMKPTAQVHKITSTIYDDIETNNYADPSYIQAKTLQNAKKILDPNIFSGNFISEGGTKPPEDIIKLLGDIHNKLTSNTNQNYRLCELLYEFMRPYLNNRIGTLLKYDEVIHIQKMNTDKFRDGQIIVREFNTDTYDFVLFKNYVSDTTCEILYCNIVNNVKNYASNIIPLTNLYHYSPYEKINQEFINKLSFNEDNLLETYTLNNA